MTCKFNSIVKGQPSRTSSATPLLPQLRSLKWRSTSPNELGDLMHVIRGSHLYSLDISFEEEAIPWTVFLAGLKTLDVPICSLFKDLLEGLSGETPRVCLSFGEGVSDLDHRSNRPLSRTLTRRTTTNSPSQLGIPLSFSATVRDLDSILSIDILLFRDLTHLSLTVGDKYGGDPSLTWLQLRNTFHLIGAACPTLEHLHLHTKDIRDEWQDHSSDAPLAVAAIEPLFSCVHLRSLRLRLWISEVFTSSSQVPGDFNLTDDEWETAASSWKELEVLEYDCSLRHGYRTSGDLHIPQFKPLPEATLTSLAYFASRCAHLRSLAIPVNASDGIVLGQTVPFGTAMEMIDLQRSWIREEAVADAACDLSKLVGESSAGVLIPLCKLADDGEDDEDLYMDEYNVYRVDEDEVERSELWQRVLATMKTLRASKTASRPKTALRPSRIPVPHQQSKRGRQR